MNTATIPTETTNAPESRITVTPVEGDELHHQFHGQHAPQDVYVTLDCETEALSASYSGIVGAGSPVNVWHGTALRWKIPALVEGAANGLLEQIVPVAERVLDGYERVWDGNNHVGRYTDDARDAISEITALCEQDWEGQTIEVWDAGDWFGGIGGHNAQRESLKITAATTDDELEAIADREETEATPRVIERLRKHLETLRAEAIAEVGECSWCSGLATTTDRDGDPACAAHHEATSRT